MARIGRVLSEMNHRGLQGVTPDPTRQAEFMQEMQGRHTDSVWRAGGCTSWYQDAKGRNTTLWPGTVAEYRKRMAQSGIEHYHPIRAID